MDNEKLVSALEKIGEGFTELAGAFEETDVISAKKLKQGKGKGKKSKAEDEEEIEIDEDEEEADEEAGEEEDEAEDDSEDEEESEDDSEDEEESEDDEEKVNALELKTLKSALRKYSTKNSKPKAVKILGKFAKVSQDVKRKDFAKLLKLLKV